jgi:hypothetical protein
MTTSPRFAIRKALKLVGFDANLDECKAFIGEFYSDSLAFVDQGLLDRVRAETQAEDPCKTYLKKCDIRFSEAAGMPETHDGRAALRHALRMKPQSAMKVLFGDSE